MINSYPNEMYDRALRQAPIVPTQNDRPSLDAALEDLEKIVADTRSRFDTLAVKLAVLTFAESEAPITPEPVGSIPPALERLDRLAGEMRMLSNQIGSVSRRIAL